LTELSLYSNQLSGSIPPEIGNLTALTVLSLRSNQLSGSIPPEIGNLTALTGLYVFNNPLSGELPAALTQLTELEHFYFSDTYLCVPPAGPVSEWLAGILDVIGTGLICGEEPTTAALNAFPGETPADGISTVLVILSNAPPGHRVRLLSSRGSVDTFANAAGVVNNDGQFTTTVCSSTPGTAIITTQDLTTGQTFATSAQVEFKGGTLPPTDEPVDIVGITAEHPLEARYLEGIPVINRILVTVDWKGTTPDRVEFVLNGIVHSQVTSGPSASYILDMGSDLWPGQNTLRIVAYNAAGQASNLLDFAPYSVPAPIWLVGLQEYGLISLPLLASGDWQSQASYRMGLHLPSEPFDIEALRFAVPDADTKLEWSIDGELHYPLDCTSPLEAEISTGASGFKFLGTEIEGKGYGGLRADRVEVCAFELPHGYAGLEVEATRTVYRKPVLVMVTYFNAAVGAAVDQIVVILHIEEFVGKLGEFYIDGKVHIAPEVQIDFSDQRPYFRFSDLDVEGGLGIEGGFRADIKVVEVKAWAGADGSIKFVRMGPVTWPPTDNWGFDSITLKGEVEAMFRVAWFEREAKGEIAWTYPSKLHLAALADRMTVSDWCLIGHPAALGYAVFNAAPGSRQAFTGGLAPDAAGLTAHTTVTSVLVSNVYTYTEPTLAVNPATDETALLWVHADLAKPVGQAHEIYFSLWDGVAWSAPVAVTDDHLLDGAPHVAWTTAGEMIAVWERLNDTLPLTATWDVTTANKIEIATAVYSPTSGQWSPVMLLTDNAALDLKPQLARNNAGDLLAAWRQNLAGLLGGDAENPDSILTAFYDGGWSVPELAVDDIPGLVDLAVGYGDGVATIAYTRYLTPTGYPTPTLQLFTSVWNSATWSAPIQRTDDNLGHRNPQVIYNAANQALLVWQAGAELRLHNLATGTTTALQLDLAAAIDTFRVVQDATGNIAAVFAAQGAQRDLYLAFYDQVHNLWGRPHALTQDRAAEAYPTAGLDAAGRLLLGYAVTAMTSVTRTMTISDTGEIITFTVPAEGPTDLMTLAHVFNRNLTLRDDDLTVSDAYPAPGETVVLSATVRNSGDLALDDVTVAFYHGDPLAGGALIGTNALSAPLAAGFTTTLNITYSVPISGVTRPLYAVADPEDEIIEVDESDNTASLAVFGPDLALSQAAVDYWGGSAVGLRTLIRNFGATVAPTTTLTFYHDALTGTMAVTDTVPALAAGEALTLTTPWDFGALAEGVYPIVAVVNQDDFTETALANNVLTLTLDVRPDLMVSSYYLWTSPVTGTNVMITATVYNIGPITATDVTVAFYRNPILLDSTLLFTRTIPVLGPGDAALVTGEVGGPLPCGVYVLADPQQILIETTRANNLAGTLVGNTLCAGFWAEPTEGAAPLTVAFTDTTGSAASAWLWSFGDGVYDTVQHPTHVYPTPGHYTVTLAVTGTGGADTLVRSAYIHVTEPTTPCVPLTDVAIAGPRETTRTLYIDNLYTFDAVVTPTDATKPTTYTWMPAPTTGQGTDSVTYRWSVPDTYTVTLTAENCGGPVAVTRAIIIQKKAKVLVYLPLVLRNH